MAEYIDKQAAIEAVNSVPAADWVSKRYAEALKRIPPANVRPVVRGQWKFATKKKQSRRGIGGQEKMADMTVDFVLERMNEFFEEPCNWTLNGIAIDEYMIENYADWCNEHCGEEGVGVQCWKKFFQSIADRSDGA